MPRKFRHAHRPQRPSRKAGFRLASWPTAVVFGLLIAGFGAGYLMQVNTASSKGFEIRTLEHEISGLKEESERLELKIAQEQSVQAVETKVKDMGMVPTPKIEYVTATVPQVARK